MARVYDGRLVPEDELIAARARVRELEARGLPEGFDYVDLGELLDVVESLIAYTRTGTFDEQDGEREVEERAKRVVARHRMAK